MSKPIFVCNIPEDAIQHVSEITESLKNVIGEDYYVLVVATMDCEKLNFLLFNSDKEEKDFEDLKQMLKDKKLIE